MKSSRKAWKVWREIYSWKVRSIYLKRTLKILNNKPKLHHFPRIVQYICIYITLETYHFHLWWYLFQQSISLTLERQNVKIVYSQKIVQKLVVHFEYLILISPTQHMAFIKSYTYITTNEKHFRFMFLKYVPLYRQATNGRK